MPPRSLVMGSPGKVRRALTDEEVASIREYAEPLRAVPARLHGCSRARTSSDGCRSTTRPARGMRDFLPEDVRRREYVIGVVADVYRALRLRAARDAGAREHRDADGQVRRRGQQAHLQGPAPRRARVVRRDRPGAALRPDRAARARGRRVPRRSCRSSSSATRFSRCGAPTARRAAASASSTSATSTRSARRRRSSRPSCARRSATCCATLGFADFVIRLNHRAVLTALLDAAGVARGPARRRRSSRIDKLDKIGRDGVREELVARGVAARRRRGCRASSRCRRRSVHGRRRVCVGVASVGADDERRAASQSCGRSSRWRATTSAGGAPALRPEPGARPVVLHRRDHGDRGAGSGRQPRRRRSLRRPDRHVPRRAGAGLRLLARPRADPRRDGGARHVPADVQRRPPT